MKKILKKILKNIWHDKTHALRNEVSVLYINIYNKGSLIQCAIEWE